MARSRYSKPKPQATIHISIDSLEFIDGHRKRRAEPNYEVLDRIITQYEMQQGRIAELEFVNSDLKNTIEILRKNQKEPDRQQQQTEVVIASLVESNVQEECIEQPITEPDSMWAETNSDSKKEEEFETVMAPYRDEKPQHQVATVDEERIIQEEGTEQQQHKQNSRTQAEKIVQQHSLGQHGAAEK